MIKPPKNYNPRTEWKLLLAIALTVAAWHLTSDITNAMDDKIERDEEWLRLVANLDYPSDCPLCDDQYFEVSSFWGQNLLNIKKQNNAAQLALVAFGRRFLARN